METITTILTIASVMIMAIEPKTGLIFKEAVKPIVITEKIQTSLKEELHLFPQCKVAVVQR